MRRTCCAAPAACSATAPASFLVEIHEEIADFGSTAEEVLALFEAYERLVAVEDDDPLLPLGGSPSGRDGSSCSRCPAQTPSACEAQLSAVPSQLTTSTLEMKADRSNGPAPVTDMIR